MTNLTELWKKGELPDGVYYFKLPNGETMIGNDYCLATYLLTKDCGKCEVLSEVPSYDEWQRILHYASKYEHEYTSCAMNYENLKQETEKLKKQVAIAKNYLSLIKRNVSIGSLAYIYVEKAKTEIKELDK